jgi:hypothetical protein
MSRGGGAEGRSARSRHFGWLLRRMLHVPQRAAPHHRRFCHHRAPRVALSHEHGGDVFWATPHTRYTTRVACAAVLARPAAALPVPVRASVRLKCRQDLFLWISCKCSVNFHNLGCCCPQRPTPTHTGKPSRHNPAKKDDASFSNVLVCAGVYNRLTSMLSTRVWASSQSSSQQHCLLACV